MDDEPSPGVCQCCSSVGLYDKVNLLSCVDFDNCSYVEMLTSCFSFNVTIPFSKQKGGKKYICDLCIISLREAYLFKSQVEETQRSLVEIPEDETKPFKQEEDETTCFKEVNGTRSNIEERFTDTTIRNEGSDVEETNWNMEYLEEYEEIVKKSPLREKRSQKKTRLLQDGNIFHRSIAEKELPGKYTATKWTKFLLTKICKVKLQCLVCKEKFHNYHMLKQHLNVHYPVFTCKHCGKSFALKRRLDKHATIHLVGEYQCNHCNKVFDTKSKWACHIATHKIFLRHYCRFCPERFHDFQQRIKHEVSLHNQPKKPFTCKQCGSTFGMAVQLSLHVRRVHLKERNKICNVCGKDFFGTMELNKHMIVHTTERNFRCERCSKTYSRISTLREHMKIHRNEKRFICRICDRSFTQKCTLKGHMKTHEKNLDNFEEIQQKDSKSELVYVYMDYKKQTEIARVATKL